MRKTNLVVVALMLITGSVFAQIPVKETKKLDEVQVPIAVRNAFEANFGTTPEGGYWMVNIIRSEYGGRTVTAPQWYSFNKRAKPERIEVRFSPEGELLQSKGLTSRLNDTDDGPVIDEKKKIG